LDLANEIVARQLSVREVEARARESSHQQDTIGKVGPKRMSTSSAVPPADSATRHIEEQLRKRLQTDVQVQSSGAERGVVKISFYGADDLERLLDLILGPTRSDFD
jgi:ParB family transcriptional regulator, chromosome partitioning protein